MQLAFEEPDAAAALPPLVLVVDDEVLVRLVAADILLDAGFEVVEACSADEAVALLAAGTRVDAVVTDVRMPGTLDGIDLLAYVKGRYPQLPVVVTSGHLAGDEFALAGADDVLPKPYSMTALVTTVARVVGRS